MNILENNRQLLQNLRESYPLSTDGLRISGNYLFLGKESCDISKFNIYDLISDNSAFVANLDSLTSYDIFKIIQLHALVLESNYAKDHNEEKLEYLKNDNPLLRNITIIPKNERTGKDEIIVIVDSTGKDNVFVNTYNIDFFDVYSNVKSNVGGRDVTPEDLISELNRRIYDVQLDSETNIKNSSETSEDFQNKIQETGKPYNDSNSINVYGNEEQDIAIVADSRDRDAHQVVTYSRDEYGDTHIEKHNQNVSVDENEEMETQEDSNKEKLNLEDSELKNEEVVLPLISEQEFYRLLQEENISEKDRMNLNTFYAFLGDLMIYEDYLLPDLNEVLNNYRLYVINLQSAIDEERINPTRNQVEAIRKEEELEIKAQQYSEKDRVVDSEPSFNQSQTEERVKRLEYRYNNPNQGFVSTTVIIACIVLVAIIMTIVTFYLVK